MFIPGCLTGLVAFGLFGGLAYGIYEFCEWLVARGGLSALFGG